MNLIEGIPGNTTHIGSRLLFLPDGTLLMTTGDAQNQLSALDLNALTGKVLRFNTDGSIPADNPMAGNPVWSWGHRNAQGLTLAPNGHIYSSEHGPTTDDEFNILQANKNYGWPEVHGFCDNPNENAYCNNNEVIEPLTVWTPTIAPSDIVWYDSPAIPEFQNTILMTVLKEKQIIRLSFNTAGDVIEDEKAYFTDDFGRLRDIIQGPDGELYIATNGNSWSNTDPFTHSIIKLTPPDLVSGIKKPSSDFAVKVVPNPSSGVFAVTADVIDFSYEVYNHLGQKILAGKHGVGELKLDMHAYSNGLYFLNIYKEGKVSSQQLVVN